MVMTAAVAMSAAVVMTVAMSAAAVVTAAVAMPAAASHPQTAFQLYCLIPPVCRWRGASAAEVSPSLPLPPHPLLLLSRPPQAAWAPMPAAEALLRQAAEYRHHH